MDVALWIGEHSWRWWSRCSRSIWSCSARRDQEISFRRVLGWSIGWTALGVAFAGVIFAWQGGGAASEYLTGFVIEKSLSIDNLFVFALVFGYFGVPAASQRRVLFWGIVGAIVLRAIFIFAGAALLDAFHYTIYVFGAFLVLTGVRMARHSDVEIHPERNPVLKLLGRVVPLVDRYDADRFLVRGTGTPARDPADGSARPGRDLRPRLRGGLDPGDLRRSRARRSSSVRRTRSRSSASPRSTSSSPSCSGASTT